MLVALLVLLAATPATGICDQADSCNGCSIGGCVWYKNSVCFYEGANPCNAQDCYECFAPLAFDDPHFYVGHGDRFDYKGKDMTIYNLLSHTNVSVNALFTHADFIGKESHRLVHGSFMRELYATVKTNTTRRLTVEFSAYQTAVARVSAEGTPAAMIRSGQMKRFDDVQVELDGRTAKITTTEWAVSASSHVKPSIVNATKCADGRCALNIAISPRFDTAKTRVAPHGLMGQSYDGDNIGIIGAMDQYKGDEFSTSAMGEGAIEGVAQDYEVADKFGTDFAFSRFGKAFAAPRNVSTLSGIKVNSEPSVKAKVID